MSVGKSTFDEETPMYGLVNKAIEEMVCTRFGEETWERIKEEAGVEEDAFLSMDAYPDDLTYKLVGAASKVLDLHPHAVLHAFGQYWVLYTAQEGYGDLMRMSGENIRDFLLHLDQMHAHVGLTFPELRPPSFQCEDIEEERLTLHYHSSREGLAPMVVGLLEGLGGMFNTPVSVTQTRSREEGADHDEFNVSFKDE